MRHDWILDVLTDLHSYACQNEMPGLAEKVELALAEALREISGLDRDDLLSARLADPRRRPH